MPSPFVIIILMGVLAGCASVVPEALQGQVDRDLAFSDLQSDPDRYQGRMVALGGWIAGVHSDDGLTELEIEELPLGEKFDSPMLYAKSGGRFVVAHMGQLDPQRYRPGRPITVVGIVQGGRVLPGTDIRDVVIKPEYLYVWPPRRRRRLAPSPFGHHATFRVGSFRRGSFLFTPTFGF